jgi:hypothetical protein
VQQKEKNEFCLTFPQSPLTFYRWNTRWIMCSSDSASWRTRNFRAEDSLAHQRAPLHPELFGSFKMALLAAVSSISFVCVFTLGGSYAEVVLTNALVVGKGVYAH